METREFDTRDEAFKAARAFTGKDNFSPSSGDDDTYNFDGGWISDLGCRFEVNFNDGRKSENFWVKEKFTAEEIRERLTQAWIQLEACRSVGTALAESLLDDGTKGAIGRILAAKEDEANKVIRQFVPEELLDK